MKQKKIHTLFLAAHAAELKPFIVLGKKNLVIKNGVAYLSAGIGPVAAVFGLTHFLEDYRPQEIIAVGTAGVINEKKFRIGDVVVAKSVATASGVDAVYTPRLQVKKIALHAIPLSPSPPPKGGGWSKTGRGDFNIKIKSAHIYSPQEITRSTDLQNQLARAGHDVEHLESFAFAFVARKFRIPIQIILGLTNVTGPSAHEEWKKNAGAMLEKIGLIVP